MIEPIAYRVLAEDLAGGDEVYSTSVAATRADFEPIAAESGLDVEDVDFESEIVFVFDLAESSSTHCAVGPIQDLVYDEALQRIYPVTGLVGQDDTNVPIECNADANPHRIIVAVPRTNLPEGGFSIWIDGGDPSGCCEDRVSSWPAE